MASWDKKEWVGKLFNIQGFKKNEKIPELPGDNEEMKLFENYYFFGKPCTSKWLCGRNWLGEGRVLNFWVATHLKIKT